MLRNARSLDIEYVTASNYTGCSGHSTTVGGTRQGAGPGQDSCEMRMFYTIAEGLLRHVQTYLAVKSAKEAVLPK
jgi:hypothetical protein